MIKSENISFIVEIQTIPYKEESDNNSEHKSIKEALDYAIHARRKTIKAEDIEIATRKVIRK